jgi:tetratricopeptide (TPR) repeat protein
LVNHGFLDDSFPRFFEGIHTNAAITDFNQAIKIDPKYVDGYYNLGLIDFRQGNHKQAIVKFNQALSINPQLPDRQMWQCLILLRTKVMQQFSYLVVIVPIV